MTDQTPHATQAVQDANQTVLVPVFLRELASLAPSPHQLKPDPKAPDRSGEMTKIAAAFTQIGKQLAAVPKSEWKAARAQVEPPLKPIGRPELQQLEALAHQLAGLLAVVPAVQQPAKGWDKPTLEQLHELVKFLLDPVIFSRLTKAPPAPPAPPKATPDGGTTKK
jgi:hypothetical protein